MPSFPSRVKSPDVKNVEEANVPRWRLPDSALAVPRTYKRGGIVRKSGWAKVHKGERVIPAAGVRVLTGPKPKKRRRKQTTRKLA